MNPSNSQGGGGKKGPPPKKQAQLGFSQGKAGLALKASKKTQLPNMHGRGETRAGMENNGGGGGTGAGNTDKGPEFATPRRGSSFPSSCGWAEACTCLHEVENATNIQGNNREGGEVTTDYGEESPLQGTRLSCKFNTLALDKVHIVIMGSFPHLIEGDKSKLGPAHNLYKKRISSSGSSSCMGAGSTILLPSPLIFCLLDISRLRRW